MGRGHSQDFKLLLAPPMNLDLLSLHLNLHPGLQNWGCCHQVSKINTLFFPSGIFVSVRISEKCWHFQSRLLCKAPHSNNYHSSLSVCASWSCLTTHCLAQTATVYSHTKNHRTACQENQLNITNCLCSHYLFICLISISFHSQKNPNQERTEWH